MRGYHGSVRAPEFPGGLDWLNVTAPLSIESLKGKIVLLDFWTYCCINCMHIIPELKKLEERFPETLVVIGVHSPKYTAERETPNIRHAALRYGVEHPIVNDADHRIWDEYAVSAWPTTVLIDPNGYVIGVQPGEFEADAYAETIAAVEKEFEKEIDRSPVSLAAPMETPESPLLYPGKIVADVPSDRLYIADTGHNRIVVMDSKGSAVDVIGDGRRDWRDGSFSNSSFNRPQGIAIEGSLLFVADTENHLIREIDLFSRTVRTIAGTGRQARLHRQGGDALATDLSSPWDIIGKDGLLLVAMAGIHQIWTMDLRANQVHRTIGTGREALGDGTLERCALAQTSGLSIWKSDLYFADSETSSIRVARFADDRVETIIGAGLFDFGDVDGDHGRARFQHCLGVQYHEGLLYVADSYNNKIKVVDPVTKSAKTLLGDGTPGHLDGPGASARLWEPADLCVSNERLYIADTNNHAIRVADLDTQVLETLPITGI